MMEDVVKVKTAVVGKLTTWYEREKRSLPWRETSDPYHIWVSEIMLQQTQVDTVIPYYRRFLEAFPTVSALAEAPLQDVLKVWENLGYYARARSLHTAAGLVLERFGGCVPRSEEDLRSLPGIGTYTAGAILSMAYGKAVPAIDGNVRRVLARLFAVEDPVDQRGTQDRIQQMAAVLVPHTRPGDYNQALMDFGATVCRAKNPVCPSCPLGGYCRARAARLQDTLPVSKKRPPLPRRLGAVALIRDRGNRILVVQRPSTGLLASLWGFPGGFIGGGDDGMEDHLKRIIKEELGIQIRVGAHLGSVRHAYTHFRLTLHVYEGHLPTGRARIDAVGNWQWVAPEAIKTLPLSKVDRMIFRMI
jgi:A/G-specific adenine glycosylase